MINGILGLFAAILEFLATVLQPVLNRISKKKEKEPNQELVSGKYEKCKSYEQLFSNAISDISEITGTDYNQIILFNGIGSHSTGLIVVADKIASGKQKYRLVINDGIISNAFQKGKECVVPMVARNLEYKNAVPETKSEAVVIIKYNENKMGVINSESDEENHYSKRMVQALMCIADEIGLRLSEMGFCGNEEDLPYISDEV